MIRNTEGSEKLGPPAHAQLDGTLVRGIAWTAGMKWGAQIFSWASTLIVARLLNPDDYGLVGMATVYLGLANLISEFGVGTTVITLKYLDSEDIAQLNEVMEPVKKQEWEVAEEERRKKLKRRPSTLPKWRWDKLVPACGVPATR